MLRAANGADVAGVVALLDRIWQAPAGEGPVSGPILHALAHTGACVLVTDGHPAAPAGAAVAFARSDTAAIAHLHVVGVAPEMQGTGLGRLLMYGVREWATAAGMREVQWTFDAAVRRNAHFYLDVLGARVIRTMPGAYGPGEDRVLARWTTGTPADALV